MRAVLRHTFEGTDLRGIFAAIATITVVGIGLSLTGPLLSLRMEAEGISSSVIGANTMMVGLASLIAVPFVTTITKTFGVVPTMIGNIVLAAGVLMGFYFTDPLPAWFILRLMFSINIAMVFVLSEFWINQAAVETKRGLILGIYGTVLSLGFAAGPAILGVVGSAGIAPFVVGACICVVALIPLFPAWNSQPVMERKEKTPSIIPYLFMVPMATFASLVFGGVEISQFSLLPIYLTQSGYTEARATALITIMLLGNVAFQIPLGIWSDRVANRRNILAFCAFVGLAGALLLPLTVANFYAVALVAFLWGGVIGGLYTVGLAHLGSRLSGTDLAQANAAFVMCYAIGAMIGPQFVGTSMDVIGPDGFGFSIAILFLGYILLYLFRRSGSR